VIGGGSELHSVIDKAWVEVENCWGVTVSGEKLTVTIQQPELYDKAGKGVIRVNGTLVYGMRIGDRIWVAPDLAALRHEFSHVVGERATGNLAENSAGKCWLYSRLGSQMPLRHEAKSFQAKPLKISRRASTGGT
jgi:hypothetical protein